MRVPALIMLASTSLPLAAEPLTIARLFADPALSGPAPRSLALSPDGERVTFLRGKADRAEQLDLWSYDVDTKKTRLLVDSALLSPANAQLSAEEQARRERARIAAYSGIVEYQFSRDGKKLLFPLNGELYLYDLSRSGAGAVRRLTHDEGAATDAKISPRGKYVSFVRGRDLWLIVLDDGKLDDGKLDDGKAFPLTLDGQGAIANGVAEFVAQEEMGRDTGYWWAPDDSKLAYARIDESEVPVQRRFEIHAERTDVVEQRYPAAGDPNVVVELRVIALADIRDGANPPPPDEMRVGERCAVDAERSRTLCSTRVDLGNQSDIYLARAGFIDADTLWFQRQSRDQRRVDLVRVALADGEQQTLLGETSDSWVELHDDLEFLERERAFTWTSDRSGERQLYAFPLEGGEPRRVTNTPWPIDAPLALDEQRGLAYVAAPGPDALEKHVYAYRLDGRGEPKRLTTEAGYHEAEFSRDASIYVTTHSDPATPPRVRLFAADGKSIAALEPNTLDDAHPYAPFRALHRVPTYGTLKSADGQVLHYGYVTPPAFDPAKRYPVIVRFYGGPGRQFVNRSWTVNTNTGLTDTLTQYWAQRGYVVFALDNRGTARRDKKFSDAIFKRMGEAEVRDQLVALDWLAAQPWADAKRVGAFGWSYGGYQALMLLAKASDRVAAGAAVAPVTDWRLYDTHYTERFLQRPDENADGYVQSSVLTQLDGLKAPLFLAHGMADDNVLFTNTTKLMAELQSRGVQFELMTYPGGKHGLVGAPTRTHVYTAIDNFFAKHLAPE
ncbi:MAG TPA: alpha/beta fold hydrolase [Candidatus Saccharimonadia bacterium]|nr:alpha/beta fold hydrolase [Candidatus Saccharimonadia bacterium]